MSVMPRLGSWLIALSLLCVPACKEEGPSPEELEATRQRNLEDAAARLRNGKVKDADAIYSKVLETHPDDPAAVAGLGKVRYEQKDYASAETLLKKAIAASPEIAEYHAILGEMYGITDRPQESADALAQAFKLDAENAGYGLAYGRSLNRIEKYEDAEKVLREVAELDPQVVGADLVGVYTLLGDALRGQKKLDEALRAYMKAQSTYGSDRMARAGAAFVYEDKQDYKHALDEWSAYIQRDCCSDYSRNVAQKKIMELGEHKAD